MKKVILQPLHYDWKSEVNNKKRDFLNKYNSQTSRHLLLGLIKFQAFHLATLAKAVEKNPHLFFFWFLMLRIHRRGSICSVFELPSRGKLLGVFEERKASSESEQTVFMK